MHGGVDASMPLFLGKRPILHRLTGHVERSREERLLELGHEYALVAERCKRRLDDLRAIALCLDRLNACGDGWSMLAQAVEYPVGLPERQRRTTRTDDEC